MLLIFIFIVTQTSNSLICEDSSPQCLALTITGSTEFFCTQLDPSVCRRTCGFCELNSECGNGQLEIGEFCDDGNSNSQDGCSASCEIEPYYLCEGEPSLCYHLLSTGDCERSEGICVSRQLSCDSGYRSVGLCDSNRHCCELIRECPNFARSLLRNLNNDCECPPGFKCAMSSNPNGCDSSQGLSQTHFSYDCTDCSCLPNGDIVDTASCFSRGGSCVANNCKSSYTQIGLCDSGEVCCQLAQLQSPTLVPTSPHPSCSCPSNFIPLNETVCSPPLDESNCVSSNGRWDAPICYPPSFDLCSPPWNATEQHTCTYPILSCDQTLTQNDHCLSEDGWPSTPASTLVTQICPDNSGIQTRFCSDSGWLPPNLDDCEEKTLLPTRTPVLYPTTKPVSTNAPTPRQVKTFRPTESPIPTLNPTPGPTPPPTFFPTDSPLDPPETLCVAGSEFENLNGEYIVPQIGISSYSGAPIYESDQAWLYFDYSLDRWQFGNAVGYDTVYAYCDDLVIDPTMCSRWRFWDQVSTSWQISSRMALARGQCTTCPEFAVSVFPDDDGYCSCPVGSLCHTSSYRWGCLSREGLILQRKFLYNCVDCLCRTTTESPTPEPTLSPTEGVFRVCDVRLYDFANFDPWEVVFDVGNYSGSFLDGIGEGINDDTAAVSVRTAGCYVTLFDEPDFQGPNVTLGFGDWSSLYGYFERDVISSLIVFVSNETLNFTYSTIPPDEVQLPVPQQLCVQGVYGAASDLNGQYVIHAQKYDSRSIWQVPTELEGASRKYIYFLGKWGDWNIADEIGASATGAHCASTGHQLPTMCPMWTVYDWRQGEWYSSETMEVVAGECQLCPTYALNQEPDADDDCVCPPSTHRCVRGTWDCVYSRGSSKIYFSRTCFDCTCQLAYCSEEGMWPRTTLGGTATVTCPDNGEDIRRRCMSNGAWQEPNLSLCPSLMDSEESGEMYAWDPHQVAVWLRELDSNLDESAQILENNGVTGEQLVGMGTNDFVSMGVPYGHAYYIYNQVRIFIASESDAATTTAYAITTNTTSADSEDDGLFSFVNDISLSDMLIVFVVLIICIVCCMCIVFCVLIRSRRNQPVEYLEDPELQAEIVSIENHFQHLFCQSVADACWENEFLERLHDFGISDERGHELFAAMTPNDRITKEQFVDFMYDTEGHDDFKQIFLDDMSNDGIMQIESIEDEETSILLPDSTIAGEKHIENLIEPDPGESVDESGEKLTETESNPSEKDMSDGDSTKLDGKEFAV